MRKEVAKIVDNQPELVTKLIDKSKEAFVMAIEVYNKPSIRYRVEGFSFLFVTLGNLCLKRIL